MFCKKNSQLSSTSNQLVAIIYITLINTSYEYVTRLSIHACENKRKNNENTLKFKIHSKVNTNWSWALFKKIKYSRSAERDVECGPIRMRIAANFIRVFVTRHNQEDPGDEVAALQYMNRLYKCTNLVQLAKQFPAGAKIPIFCVTS